jgi:hypothetical protein
VCLRHWAIAPDLKIKLLSQSVQNSGRQWQSNQNAGLHDRASLGTQSEYLSTKNSVIKTLSAATLQRKNIKNTVLYRARVNVISTV